MLLINTITPFDIYDDTPFYNENVYRAYANIVVAASLLVTDPTSGVGLRDRFGHYYERVVKEASGRVERQHLTPEARTHILSLENDIDGLRTKRDGKERDLAAAWTLHYQALGLKPNSVEFDLERINYYNSSGIATQVSDIFTEIITKVAEIQRIKEGVVPNDLRILVTLDSIIRSKEYKMYRPPRPQLERSGSVTYWELAKFLATARNVTSVGDVVEEGEQILPFTNLGGIFGAGERSFTIKKGVTDIERHDLDWSVSGSGRKFGIFKAKASASYSRKIEESLKSTNEISVSFANVDEFLVNRRDWYDASIFAIPVVRDVLESNRILADNTRNAITSVFVGRGTAVGFKFEEKTHYQEIRDIKGKIGGSATIGFLNFGGKGNYHKYDFELEDREQEQTITFKDGPEVCRVLGYRVDEVHSIGAGEQLKSFMLEGEYRELLETRAAFAE